MALTVTRLGIKKYQQGHDLILKLVPTGSYATPGELLDFDLYEQFTSKQPIAVIVTNTAGYMIIYDIATKRLKFHLYDYNNAADGPTIEIPDAAYPAALLADVQIIAVATFINSL